MKVATHDGSFHADDVFAIAVLRLRTPDLEIVRTRDTDVIAACDARVDVGLHSDPATGDFDHHQKGGAGGSRERDPVRVVRARLARVRRRGVRWQRAGRPARWTATSCRASMRWTAASRSRSRSSATSGP
ncbi:MYG1 family protein [Svornostia abyssi]|uniref:MYG1 family protein n=1 Tax=Svornostia abyssi TaxID=2898438 RepID=UPI0033905464